MAPLVFESIKTTLYSLSLLGKGEGNRAAPLTLLPVVLPKGAPENSLW